MARNNLDLPGPGFSHSPQTITMPNCRCSYRRLWTVGADYSVTFGIFPCQAIELRTGTQSTMCIKGVDEANAEYMRSVLKCGNKGEIKAVYTDGEGASVTAEIEVLMPTSERDHADCFDEAGEVTDQRNLYFAVKGMNINRQPARRSNGRNFGAVDWAHIAMPVAVTQREYERQYLSQPNADNIDNMRRAAVEQQALAKIQLDRYGFAPLELSERERLLRGEVSAADILQRRRDRAAEQTAQREREQNYPKINSYLTGPTPVSEIKPKPTDAPKRRFAIKRPDTPESE